MKNTRIKPIHFLGIALFFLIFAEGCQPKKSEEQDEKTTSTMKKESYGTTKDGTAVDIYTLTNAHGVEARITNYGGIIVSLKVPDRTGALGDVVLGFDSLSTYIASNPYFGALVGRYGNRIANGRFMLDNVEYKLAQNNSVNHLHGGLKGFDKVVWNAEEGEDGKSLKLTYVSMDMEEGYPGNLTTEVTYTLEDDDALKIDYKATTDKKTVINLTNHSYFNLTGDPSNTILDHVVMINADQFVPVNSTLIPTGELQSVKGTPFDFTSPKPVGQEIEADHEQIKVGLGYDHCWVLNGNGMKQAATVYEPNSGRFMEVRTTEPGVQFYTGNFLNGTLTGKKGTVYQRRSGFCFETEHFPDSPNQPDFPSVELNPGETYQTSTVYKFSVKNEQ